MNVIVTGASRGLGLAIAEAFVKNGDNVFIGARSKNIGDIARKISAHGFELDIANEDSVKAFIQKASLHFNGIVDVLVNNAGICGPMDFFEKIDLKQWVDTIQVNLIGAVYMCQYTLPLLKKSSNASIINLSGGGATAPMPNMSAYAASKAGLVRFTETLALELIPFNITVNAVAPGTLNTAMLDEVLAAGPEKIGQQEYDKYLKRKTDGGAPMDKATGLCLHLAKNRGVTGKLISAIWDNWSEIDASVNGTDIYTLRRITK